MTTKHKTELDHTAKYKSDKGKTITVEFYQAYIGTDDYGPFKWTKTGNLNPKSLDGRELTGTIDALTDLDTGEVFKKITDTE